MHRWQSFDEGSEKMWQALAEICGPTLLRHGQNSLLVSREAMDKMAGVMMDAQVVQVLKAGHSVPGDNPVGFARVVDAFDGQTR